MITGFNTNVRYRGTLFHVQTEDSGRAHPHIISHVYCGGTILASEKSGYAERLQSTDLGREVRVLMEAQHKSMIARLEQGEFDAAIAERLQGAAPPASEAAPADVPPTRGSTGPAPRAPASGTPRRPARAQPPARSREPQRPFGEGIVSQKPLDEVILDYLVQKSRASRTKG